MAAPAAVFLTSSRPCGYTAGETPGTDTNSWVTDSMTLFTRPHIGLHYWVDAVDDASQKAYCPLKFLTFSPFLSAGMRVIQQVELLAHETIGLTMKH
jgi:hypothetical protein